MHSAEFIIETTIGMAIEMHRSLGPGLLESAYQRILRDELELAGFSVDVEPSLAVRYNGREYPHSFRADLVVNGLVVIELKCTEKTAPVHRSQLLTYLR